MQRGKTKKRPGRHRPGTAVQPKGQQRAEDILQAAKLVLVEEGYAALTTRKVANKLGIRQSNVQYYYPMKVDLVQALFEKAMETHAVALAERLASGRISPKRRVLWSLDFNLKTHESREQIVFMRELWALASHDAEVARVMHEFYCGWIDLATQTLLEFNPKLGMRRAQRRALAIISMVDGLSLFHGAEPLDHPAVKGIEQEVRSIVLKIAGEA